MTTSITPGLAVSTSTGSANVPSYRELARAQVILYEMEEGTSPPYNDERRKHFARLAVAGLRTGKDDLLCRENIVARDLASSMAVIDGDRSDNPFIGTALEKIYTDAQRWQAHVRQQNDSADTLQQLLNQRTVLIDRVEMSSLSMHAFQVAEVQMWLGKVDGLNSEEDHKVTKLQADDAAHSFWTSVRLLGEFRQHPTNNPELAEQFRRVEAMEVMITKTEQGMRDAERAGIAPTADDWADLRNINLSLKAFLQTNNATMPVRTYASSPSLSAEQSAKVNVVPQNNALRA
jgi:hypothetical protein